MQAALLGWRFYRIETNDLANSGANSIRTDDQIMLASVAIGEGDGSRFKVDRFALHRDESVQRSSHTRKH